MSVNSTRKDFLNRGEVQHLGPIFAKISLGDLLAAYMGPPTVETVEVAESQAVIQGKVAQVYVSAGYVTGSCAIVPDDDAIALASQQCKVTVDPTTGASTVTFFADDEVTEAIVSYEATVAALTALLEDEI